MKDTHGKSISVKKGPGRIAFRIMACVLFVCWVGTMIVPDTREFSQVFSLTYFIIGLPFQLYYELWRITFTSKGIHIRRWPFREKTYPYSMIKEVTKGYSAVENDYLICCVFTDGKSVTFRLRDANANLAVKRLLSHRSFRTIQY